MEIKIRDRIEGIIWGQFIGDALCMGAHWIFNLKDSKTFYPELKSFQAPLPGHDHDGKKPGVFTRYGEVAMRLSTRIGPLSR